MSKMQPSEFIREHEVVAPPADIAAPGFVPLWRSRTGLIVSAVLACVAGFAVWQFAFRAQPGPVAHAAPAPASGLFYPTKAQWATLTVAPVRQEVFRTGAVTEGKIAVNEDIATPVYSPYAGRVTRLLAKPGDRVERDQPLFMIETADAVQAQNDLISALAASNKARSQLNLTETVERRLRALYQDKAVALREVQQAESEAINARNDLRAADSGLQAARNRLRILGRSDAEIDSFQTSGTLTRETAIVSPIGGTVVQRRVGPGQFLSSGAPDPVFVVGDLSSVWLVAYIREADAPHVRVGQGINFSVLAFPDRTFTGKVSYVGAALEPNTRRLAVRAVIDNAEGLFRPEMFANVTVFTGDETPSAAVPREAILYEGSAARVWAVTDGEGIEMRRITPGLNNGKYVQVLDGLKPGERVVTRGSLFIDRIATGG
jgi:cobalt-zinc-cadmium efflux system membrane fusion protein